MNFKNVCLSLSRHHQKLAAINRSGNTIFKKNTYGPMQRTQEDELSRVRQRISSALSIDQNSINTIEAFKWLTIHGTKYVINECHLAVKFDDEEYPLFGKLCGLWEINLHFIVFDVILLETVGFSESLNAYEVRTQASAVVSVTPDMIITHTPLPVYSFNGSSYIKLKCDISDLKE